MCYLPQPEHIIKQAGQVYGGVQMLHAVWPFFFPQNSQQRPLESILMVHEALH